MKWRWSCCTDSFLGVVAGTACGDEEGGSSTTDAGPADVGTEDTQPEDTGAPTSSCNYILNEGCAADEKCSFPTSGAKKAECTPAGEKAIGEECSGIGDCKEGICISLNDTGNLCYKFCKTMAHCDMDECLDLKDSPYKVCELDVDYETCDMLAQDCTKAGQGCYVTDDGAVCLPSGTAGIDDECESVSDCAPGGVCINKRCKKVCDKTENDPCGNFKPCANYYGNAGYCDE